MGIIGRIGGSIQRARQRRNRVMTYDDLDQAGGLPGQNDSGPYDPKLAHNSQLDYTRLNSYTGPH